MEFKKGDKVKCAFFGEEVFELREDKFGSLFFDRDRISYFFTNDGRREPRHTHPVLTLVEKAKKIVRYEYWINIDHREGYFDMPTLHHSKECADNAATSWRVSCEYFEGEFEVDA